MRYGDLTQRIRYRLCGPIGAAVGGGISAAGGLVAGSKLAKAYKKQQQLYDNRLSEVRAHRDSIYYQDPTQSAENRAAVTNAQAVLDAANKKAAATSVVTGGTDESAALAKQTAAGKVGDMMQTTAVDGAKNKENVWNNADNEINTFTKYKADAIMGQGAAQAKAIQDAAAGLSKSANAMPW